jgi:hypothetical protein
MIGRVPIPKKAVSIPIRLFYMPKKKIIQAATRAGTG